MEAKTHEGRYRYTPDDQNQFQRMKQYLHVPDRLVHISPSKYEYVTAKNGTQTKFHSCPKGSESGQSMLENIERGRDYCDVRQKVKQAHKPESSLHPMYGRQNSKSGKELRQTLILNKHELPKIVESETSSTTDSSIQDDPPKDNATPCYKLRRSSGNYIDEHVKSGNAAVHGRNETVMLQYYPNGRNETVMLQNYPKNSCLSDETRAGTAISYMKQTTPEEHRDPNKTCPMIEVAPGKLLRLRGAEETWHAIRNDFYSPCMCFCCEQTLFCIKDANCVLCPTCRVVGPLEQGHQEDYDGGVGLGVTMKDLAKWQSEIFEEIDSTQCE